RALHTGCLAGSERGRTGERVGRQGRAGEEACRPGQAPRARTAHPSVSCEGLCLPGFIDLSGVSVSPIVPLPRFTIFRRPAPILARRVVREEGVTRTARLRR